MGTKQLQNQASIISINTRQTITTAWSGRTIGETECKAQADKRKPFAGPTITTTEFRRAVAVTEGKAQARRQKSFARSTIATT